MRLLALMGMLALVSCDTPTPGLCPPVAPVLLPPGNNLVTTQVGDSEILTLSCSSGKTIQYDPNTNSVFCN